MNCFRCGVPLQPGASFCPSCGFTVHQNQQPMGTTNYRPASQVRVEKLPPSWLIILLLPFCTPLGIWFLWKGGWPIGWKVTLTAIFASMFLAAYVKTQKESNSQTSTVSASSPAPSVIHVSADSLGQEYLDNEIASNQKYKGQMINVTGTVTTVKSGSFGSAYSEFSPKNGLIIICSYSWPHANELANVRTGSTLTVRGRCTGTFQPFKHSDQLAVSLKNCSID